MSSSQRCKYILFLDACDRSDHVVFEGVCKYSSYTRLCFGKLNLTVTVNLPQVHTDVHPDINTAPFMVY